MPPQVIQSLAMVLLNETGTPMPTTEIGWLEWAWKTGGMSLVGVLAFVLTAWRAGSFLKPIVTSIGTKCVEFLGVMIATQSHVSERVDQIAEKIDHIDHKVNWAAGVIRRNCGKHEPESDDEMPSSEATTEIDQGKKSK